MGDRGDATLPPRKCCAYGRGEGGPARGQGPRGRGLSLGASLATRRGLGAEKRPKNGSRALSEQRASMKVYMFIYIYLKEINKAFHGIFPAVRIPRFCTGFGIIPWSLEKCEIPCPHKQVRDKCEIPCPQNESRAIAQIPFPQNKSRDNVDIPNSVIIGTKNPVVFTCYLPS